MRVKSKVMVFTVVLVLLVSTAWAKNPVGLLMSGFDASSKVVRGGEELPCEQGLELYEGDEIVGNVKALEVKWAPYASGTVVSENRMRITFQPPSTAQGLLAKVKDFLGFAELQHQVGFATTRGLDIMADQPHAYLPQPGFNATVLPTQKILFSWGKPGAKAVLFYDSKGAQVYRKTLTATADNSGSFAYLTPEEVGMKPDEVYTWKLEGVEVFDTFRVRLLKSDLLDQLSSSLREIDQETPQEKERTSRKAAYVQFLSDAYPKEIDLYWYSYDLIKSANDVTTKVLKSRIRKHISDSYPN